MQKLEKRRKPAARAPKAVPRSRGSSTKASVRKAPGGRKRKAYATFDRYLADQSARNQRILRALRGFVRRVAPELVESVKWGNGCWLKGKVPVSYVHADTELVQFGFFRGSALADPRALLEGRGQYVRHIKVRTISDIDERAFGALLRQARRGSDS
jgi:hypothetical protein